MYLSTNAIPKTNTLKVLVQVVLSSLFIALCAQIRIPLPFTPVPLTMQTFAVLLVGGYLGSKNGALSVMLYLAETMLGLPVLSGGRVDMLALFSPVGGYLIGFIFQAYLSGWVVERQKYLGKTLVSLGLTAACAVQLLCGAFVLAFYVGAERSLLLGVLPFIPGELIKVSAAAAILARYRR